MFYFLDNQVFESQKEAFNYIRSKLKSFNENDPLWFELLDRHPDSQIKRGCGVKRFFATQNNINRTAIQLNVERVDGSTVDISWLKCVTGKANTDKEYLYKAMREAIFHQIEAFKNEAEKPYSCAICGNKNLKRVDIDIDHDAPLFVEIAKSFLDQTDNHPVAFNHTGKVTAKFLKRDSAFEEAWAQYHLDNANLRVTCRTCNRSRSR